MRATKNMREKNLTPHRVSLFPSPFFLEGRKKLTKQKDSFNFLQYRLKYIIKKWNYCNFSFNFSDLFLWPGRQGNKSQYENVSNCLVFLKRKSEKVTERKILLLWVASPWFVVVLVVLFCFCLFVCFCFAYWLYVCI